MSRIAVIALFSTMAALVVVVLGLGQAALRRANRELGVRASELVDANERLQSEMAERARAEEQLRQSQKLQALGQLTGGIAHDFNNLLTVIQGSADLLRRPNLADEKRLRYADAIAQTAERAAALTSQLLAFARRQPLSPEVLDVNERLRRMTAMFERLLGATIAVKTDLAEDLCHAKVDPTQLEVAILNVVVNARDAMVGGGTLTISTANVEADGGPVIAISIRDTGTGMSADTVARSVEPFFTTKGVGKGTGLGLSQVYGFATQSGGDIVIDSEIGLGTTVTIRLPCTQEQVRAPEGSSRGSDRARGGTILLVEDNSDVGEFAHSLLIELGYSVHWVRSAEEAIGFVTNGGDFDVLFTDIVMPGMSGVELAQEILRQRPGTPILLATGYSEWISNAGSAGFPLLQKPYRSDRLIDALDQAFEQCTQRIDRSADSP
jgi:signal transduction histidine kinase/CheY-like chemotaxis protein